MPKGPNPRSSNRVAPPRNRTSVLRCLRTERACQGLTCSLRQAARTVMNDSALLSPTHSYPSLFSLSQESVPPGDWWVEDLPTLIHLSVQGRLYVAPSTDHHGCRTPGDFGARHGRPNRCDDCRRPRLLDLDRPQVAASWPASRSCWFDTTSRATSQAAV